MSTPSPSSRPPKRPADGGVAPEKHRKSAKLTVKEDGKVGGPKRDPNYYFKDGNIVLRVEDTLFRAHRSLLGRDSSAFEDMLSLPPGRQAVEGNDDENPVVISGDTVEEFRGLMWALYALPLDVRASLKSDEELKRMAEVAILSHKYGFRQHEGWAVQALDAYTHDRQALPIASSSYERLITTAAICNMERLLALVIEEREKHVDKLASTRETGIMKVLLMANRLGLSGLEGYSYYRIMLLGSTYWKNEEGLSSQHKGRLLNGFHGLTETAKELSDNIPTSGGASCCNYCQEIWKNTNKSTPIRSSLAAIDVANVLEKLRFLRTQFAGYSCRNGAKCIGPVVLLEQRLTSLKRELITYFVDF